MHMQMCDLDVSEGWNSSELNRVFCKRGIEKNNGNVVKWTCAHKECDWISQVLTFPDRALSNSSVHCSITLGRIRNIENDQVLTHKMSCVRGSIHNVRYVLTSAVE